MECSHGSGSRSVRVGLGMVELAHCTGVTGRLVVAARRGAVWRDGTEHVSAASFSCGRGEIRAVGGRRRRPAEDLTSDRSSGGTRLGVSLLLPDNSPAGESTSTSGPLALFGPSVALTASPAPSFILAACRRARRLRYKMVAAASMADAPTADSAEAMIPSGDSADVELEIADIRSIELLRVDGGPPSPTGRGVSGAGSRAGAAGGGHTGAGEGVATTIATVMRSCTLSIGDCST